MLFVRLVSSCALFPITPLHFKPQVVGMSSASSCRAPSLQSESCVSSPYPSLATPLTGASVLFNDLSTISLPQVFNNNASILVVGGLGYIGSHTAWELLKDGYNVIIIDNLSNAFRSVLINLHLLMKDHFKTSMHKPLLEFHEADYRDQATMNLILSKYSVSPKDGTTFRRSRISGVIHFAAYKAVAESIQEPLKYYSNNVSGLVDLCSLLGDFGIKTFIFSSSATVYGETANYIGRISEEHCTHQETSFFDVNGKAQTTIGGCSGITNPYGRTKWMCEAILHDLAASDPEWKIFALRYFNPIGCDPSGILGEDPRAVPSNLLPVVVKVMTGEMPVLNIYGSDWDTEDGTAVRDFIHVSDLARGHLAAIASVSKLASHESGFRTFNLGSGKGHSVLEVVAFMEAASGKKIPVRLMGRRDGDVALCVAEPTRAAAELNWRTEKTLQNGCEDICRFLAMRSS